MRSPFLCLILALTGAAAAAPVTIPFQTTRGMIVVEATIANSDTPLQFIVDSGAGQSVIAKTTASALGLETSGTESIRTVNGSTASSRAQNTVLNLGPDSQSMRFSTRPLVMDLSRESRLLGTPLAGLIGMDFFEGRLVQIDFKASCLRVSPAGKPDPNSIRLPLSRGTDGFFVPLKAKDASLARVRVDTGCSRSLCWTPPERSIRGLWGNGKTHKTAVHFGNLVVPEVSTDLYRQPLFPGEDGLLGTALLSRFESVWIDAAKRQIVFDPAGD